VKGKKRKETHDADASLRGGGRVFHTHEGKKEMGPKKRVVRSFKNGERKRDNVSERGRNEQQKRYRSRRGLTLRKGDSSGEKGFTSTSRKRRDLRDSRAGGEEEGRKILGE